MARARLRRSGMPSTEDDLAAKDILDVDALSGIETALPHAISRLSGFTCRPDWCCPRQQERKAQYATRNVELSQLTGK